MCCSCREQKRKRKSSGPLKFDTRTQPTVVCLGPDRIAGYEVKTIVHEAS